MVQDNTIPQAKRSTSEIRQANNGRLSGEMLRGYEFLERIGYGGFGEVYRAHQPAIGREVAVKVILPRHANHPEFIRRFEIEAQLIAQLEHPHIVPLYDYWREPDGAFLVMRWLRGGNLRQGLENLVFELDQVTRIVEQLASALNVAHRHGVVHRDLKPANIMFDENLNAYLTDFGIAKDLNTDSGLTHENTLMGSLAYLSPEQIQGELVTPQADIYSLGIITFEMLTGQHPFGDVTMSTFINKHLYDDMPLVVEFNDTLPTELDVVIARATRKMASERYQSALQLAAELNDVMLGLFDESGPLAPSTSHHEILQRVGVTEVDNPYKGLQAFQESDAENLFGRKRLIEHMLKRLEDDGNEVAAANLLVIVGPSGCGKSSLIRAGLLPALRQGSLRGSENWYSVQMLPGTHPLEELEAALLCVSPKPLPSLLDVLRGDVNGLDKAVEMALPNAQARIVLFIDQFEEIFTLVRDEQERDHFIALLNAAALNPQSRLVLLCSLRADYYDKPLQYPQFAEIIQQRTEFVLPMTSEDLREAITAPAQRLGVWLEKGLVEIIMQDIHDQPGALPLLQYALHELFEERDGNAITLDAYHKIGGVLGALARRAEELYGGLSAHEQRVTRILFLRLLSMDSDAYDGVLRVDMPELLVDASERETMQRMIDLFGKHRLLTFDRDPITRVPTISVAHESLVRRWTRLQHWLSESKDAMRAYQHLAVAAQAWSVHERADDYLLVGVRIHRAQELLKERFIVPGPLECAFIQASTEHAERTQAERDAQVQQYNAMRRQLVLRTRLLIAAVVMALVFALIAVVSVVA
jgi:serine/threonine protein kinase